MLHSPVVVLRSSDNRVESSCNMQIGNSDLIRTIRFFAKLFGNGFNPSSSLLYICYSIIFHGCATFIFVFCLCLSIFFITSVDETTHCLYMSLTCLAYAFKVANYYYYHREIYTCLGVVKMFELRNEEEVLIYNRRNDRLTRIAWFYYIIPTVCGGSAYFKPFLYENVQLPFRAWYPFDWRNVEEYYWIAWAYQVVGMCFIILNNVTIDLTPTYLLNIVAIQTEILGLRLSKLGKIFSADKFNMSPFALEQQQNFRDLVDCIKLHQSILS